MNIAITNPDKLLFPKDKIKKIDVIKYYIEISELILPFVKNRILSVIRCHQGVRGQCFFKKHPTTDKDNVAIFQDNDEEYFYITNQKQLIMQVQNGTLEFHPWGSTIKKLENPDVMVFDLDPDEKLSLATLRQAVLHLKSILDELGLISFLKTSGGKGYHIVVPFGTTKDWDGFYTFSKQVAMLAENRWPKLFTTNMKKSKRKGKIFVDYLRNNRGSTCVCPYSIRSRDHATISMPIAWEDLDHITPNEVTIKNYHQYLSNAWDNFFDIHQKLK